MSDREFIAVFHYDNGGTNRCGAEPYRYAEEIVRCKECKHRTYCYSEVHMTNKRQTIDTHKDLDFCSYGEREGE
jgi:hypothetical protein